MLDEIAGRAMQPRPRAPLQLYALSSKKCPVFKRLPYNPLLTMPGPQVVLPPRPCPLALSLLLTPTPSYSLGRGAEPSPTFIVKFPDNIHEVGVCDLVRHGVEVLGGPGEMVTAAKPDHIFKA